MADLSEKEVKALEAEALENVAGGAHGKSLSEEELSTAAGGYPETHGRVAPSFII